MDLAKKSLSNLKTNGKPRNETVRIFPLLGVAAPWAVSGEGLPPPTSLDQTLPITPISLAYRSRVRGFRVLPLISHPPCYGTVNYTLLLLRNLTYVTYFDSEGDIVPK